MASIKEFLINKFFNKNKEETKQEEPITAETQESSAGFSYTLPKSEEEIDPMLFARLVAQNRQRQIAEACAAISFQTYNPSSSPLFPLQAGIATKPLTQRELEQTEILLMPKEEAEAKIISEMGFGSTIQDEIQGEQEETPILRVEGSQESTIESVEFVSQEAALEDHIGQDQFLFEQESSFLPKQPQMQQPLDQNIDNGLNQ